MNASLDWLHPDLKPLAQEWLDNCHAVGLKVSITFTWRSIPLQNIMYAQGRTAPGEIITNAAGGESLHCFTLSDDTPASKAFDWACFDDDSRYISDGSDPKYAQAGAIGEKLGLSWGGRWHHPDFDHLELVCSPSEA